MSGRKDCMILAAGMVFLLGVVGMTAAETMSPTDGDSAQQDLAAPQPVPQATNVPEPATMILLGGGLGIMIVLKKRNRQQFVRGNDNTSDQAPATEGA